MNIETVKKWSQDCIEQIKAINNRPENNKSFEDVILILISKNPTELGYSKAYLEAILNVKEEFSKNQGDYDLSYNMREFFKGEKPASKIFRNGPNGPNIEDDDAR